MVMSRRNVSLKCAGTNLTKVDCEGIALPSPAGIVAKIRIAPRQASRVTWLSCHQSFVHIACGLSVLPHCGWIEIDVVKVRVDRAGSAYPPSESKPECIRLRHNPWPGGAASQPTPWRPTPRKQGSDQRALSSCSFSQVAGHSLDQIDTTLSLGLDDVGAGNLSVRP